jgi:Rod binding domain-containing protein
MEVGQVSRAQLSGPQNASRIWRAAREFEGLLLANLLGPLERSFSGIGGEEQISGSHAYQSLGIQAVASVLANHGGTGIAAMIARSLMQSEGHGKAKIRLKFSGALPIEQTGQLMGDSSGNGPTVKGF